MKKASIFLICILIISFFSCCNNKKNNTDVNSDNVTIVDADKLFTDTDIGFTDKNGNPKYRIVRPADCSDELSKAISDLRAGIKENFGVGLYNVSDDNSEEEFEILVGDTNRSESKLCINYVNSVLGGRYNDYIVGTVGNKLVISGNCDAAVINAINKFVKSFGEDGKLKGGLILENRTEGDFLKASVCGKPILDYKIVRPHYNSSYITQIQLNELCEFCENKLGYSKTIYDDAYLTVSPYEIVVGNTDRGGEKVKDYDTFYIKAEKGKVFINGGNAQSVAAGVSEFIKMLENGGIEEGFYKEFDTAEYVAKLDHRNYYTVKWFDEFDGDTIDTTKWKNGQDGFFDTGVGGKIRCRDTDPQFVFQENGLLYMQGHQDDEHYYGAMIQTPHKLAFKYGIIESSEIIPHGDGFWIALYLESSGIEPTYMKHEIDINEMFGNANVIAANLHLWPTQEGKDLGYAHTSLDKDYSNKKKRFSLDGRTFNEDFHNYGCIWTPEMISFTCDGEIYFEFDITSDQLYTEAYTTHSTYIKLGYNIGGADNPLSVLNATEEQWQNSSALITDNIYIYQLEDGNSYLYNGY